MTQEETTAAYIEDFPEVEEVQEEEKAIGLLQEQNELMYDTVLDEVEKRNNTDEMVDLFIQTILESPNALEKIKKLEKRGIVGMVVPEFEELEKYEMNKKHYEKGNAKEQSLYLLEQVEQGVELEEYKFTEIKNAKQILKLAALLSRIGIPDAFQDPNNPTKYFAYEKKSATKAQQVMQRMNEVGKRLYDEEYFTDQDQEILQILIENHGRLQRSMMKPGRYSWEQEKGKRVRDWTKSAYPTRFLNKRINFEESIELGKILGYAEVLTLKGGNYKTKTVSRYKEFEGMLEENMQDYEMIQQERTLKYFVDGADLKLLGISEGKRIKEVLKDLVQKQMCHEISTREEAIRYVCEKEELNETSEQKIQEVLRRKRAIRYRMENMQSIDVEKRKGYILQRYIAEPIKQFDDNVTLEELRSTLYNGNYPDLVMYLEAKANAGSPEEIIKDLLNKGFANLDQIEGIIRRQPDYRIEETKEVHAPLARHTEVIRDNGERIILENGFQGREHQGTGRVHISHQRQKELIRGFAGKDIKAETNTEKETTFTREDIQRASSLEARVSLESKDTEAVLEVLKNITGKDLIPRSEVLHITIIGPTETSALREISLSQLQKLRDMSKGLQRRVLNIQGIGYIDGSDPEGSAGIPSQAILPKDMAKTTSFISLKNEEIQEIRRVLGLQEKDLHITLGFEGGDIHMMRRLDKKGKVVLNDKGEAEKVVIPKKANENLRDLQELLPKEIVLQKIRGKSKIIKRLETPEIIQEIDERFFEDGIIKTAGDPSVEIINSRKAKEGSKIALRRIDNTEFPQYCGIILLNTGEKQQRIVTSLFYRDKKALRVGVRLFLRQIYKNGEIEGNIYNKQIKVVNKYLKSEGIGEFTRKEIEEYQEEKSRKKGQRETGKASQEIIQFFRKKGFAQKQMGRLIGVIEGRKKAGELQNDEEAMRKLEGISGHDIKDYINALKNK